MARLGVEPANDVVKLLLQTPFHSLPSHQKHEIKTAGRPLPLILFAKKKDKVRNFNPAWYGRYTWLTGSKATNLLYCWPCLLMGKSQTWTVNGFGDIKNLDRATRRHDKCKEHLVAFVRFKLLGRMPIDQGLDEGLRLQIAQHNEMVRRNRDALKRLIDTTTAFLGMQELAFMGHSERDESDTKGNCKELAEVIARYDALLGEHLESTTVFSAVSKTIQNDLLSSIATTIKDEVQKEMDAAPFFSWQIDETADIGCHSQLSVIVRYVDEQGVIQERFLGFFDVSDRRDAQSLFAFMEREMSAFNFAEKLIAHTYDGAAVMASELNGLQAKVSAVAPSSMFVHCYAHRLDLVLSQGVKTIPKAKVFFATLAGFTSFFSTERSVLLEDAGWTRKPKSAPTCWNFTPRIVSTVASNYEQLMDTFTNIIEQPTMDDETVRMADGLKAKLEDFEFMFLLFTFEQVFAQTDAVFETLQHKDISMCKKHVTNLMEKLGELKSEGAFDETYNKAADFTEDAAIMHIRKRRRGTKDPREIYRRLYNTIHDSLRTQIEQRYQHLHRLRFMEFMDFEMFDYFDTHFPSEALESLSETYGNLFDLVKLKGELQFFYSDEQIHANSKLCDSMLFMKTNGLDEAMPELYRLMCLIATNAVTSAGVERSSSCLSRIKTYTRNTMGQGRLRNLGIFSIERNILKSLQKTPNWYEKTIDIFANQTNRRMDFQFK